MTNTCCAQRTTSKRQYDVTKAHIRPSKVLEIKAFRASGHQRWRDDLTAKIASTEHINHLVGHHHTFRGIDGIDYQILIEADYIANASENGYSRENVMNFMNKIMKTESGKNLIKAVFVL